MPEAPRQTIGRYELRGEIAAGGMATVHYGRLLGAVGFSRTVAIKRLHPQYAKDPEFVSMFLDEARLAARIRHPNVIATLDVEALDGELFLVMEYVQGEALSRLLTACRDTGARVPHPVIVAIMSGILHGLHAAHEARSERGEPLGIVHRDVSPQNMLVGTDGIARVLDFGVAKAAIRAQSTREGQIKGKLSYMAPEQLRAQRVDRRSDVYAAAVVLWEALAGKRLFQGDDAGALVNAILSDPVLSPSAHDPAIPAELDAVVLRGLARDANARFATAREMAIALEKAVAPAAPREVGDFVEKTARDALARRQASIAAIENVSVVTDAVLPVPVPVPVPVPGSAPAPAPVPVPVPGEPNTAVYTASSDSPPSMRPTPKRRALAALGVAAAMALASGGTLMITRMLDRAAPAARATVPAIATEAAATSPATAAAPTATAEAPPEATDPPATAAPASSPPGHTTARVPRGARRAPAKASPSASPSAVPRPECNPGYYFDEQGLKVWRAECFPKK